jgi:RHS repeat-associated protein
LQRIDSDYTPSDLTLADLNGDGHLDLIVADQNNAGVRIYLGNGNGTFGASSFFNVGVANQQFPTAVTVGHLNEDAVLDLFVQYYDVNTITVRSATLLGGRNPTTGKWDGLFVIKATGGSPGLLADVTGDGIDDLVTAGGTEPGNGDGTFGAIVLPETLPQSALVDLNGDGYLDAIGPSTTGKQGLVVAAGRGHGLFADPVTIPFANCHSFAGAADLDGDGHVDLVAEILPSGNGPYNLSVRLSNGMALGSPGQPRTYTYDPKFNKVTSETDDLGRMTVDQIDPNNGNLLSKRLVVGQVDSPQNGETDDIVTTYTYTPQGQVKNETDPLGRVTHYDYYPNGEVKMITYATGTPESASKQFEYDAAGNQTAVIDENHHRTTYQYDALNRLIATTDALGNQTLTSYYPDGKVETVTRVIGQLDSPANGEMDDQVTHYTYTPMGQLETEADPDPDGPGPLKAPTTVRTYYPDGDLKTLTNALGIVTFYAYNDRRQLTKVVEDYTLNPADGQNRETDYNYDTDGNLKYIKDPDQNVTTYDYFPRQLLHVEHDPNGGTITYEYDAAGRLTAKVDRDGRRIEYGYDRADHVTSETWIVPGGVSTNPADVVNVINSQYDKAGNLLIVADRYSRLVFTYDDRNRLTAVDNGLTPMAPFNVAPFDVPPPDAPPTLPHVVLTYTYDPASNLATLNDSMGGVNTYTPDALNRVAFVSQTGTGVDPKSVAFTYNEVGEFKSIDRYAAATVTPLALVAHSQYTYDSLNRLDKLVHSDRTQSELDSFTYTYDDGGRTATETDVDGTVTYTYDHLDQLTSATYTNPINPNVVYPWDANGNPASSGIVIGPGNRLKSDATFDYQYDGEGNLMQQTDRATGNFRVFAWDYHNRLVQVTDETAAEIVTQVVRYYYDGLDRRIAKAVDTTPQDAVDAVFTHFVYDRDNVLMEFVDDDGSGPHAPVLSMRYLDGPAVDQVLAQENFRAQDQTLRVLWLLPDRLGSTRDLVDNTGTVRNHIIYDAFGKVIFQTHPEVGTRYFYTGREFDTETGLYYYRARYYDPRTGEFLSEDPHRLNKNTANLYRYVKNNPVSAIDPTGKDDVSVLSYDAFAAHEPNDIKIIEVTYNVAEVNNVINFITFLFGGEVDLTGDILFQLQRDFSMSPLVISDLNSPLMPVTITGSNMEYIHSPFEYKFTPAYYGSLEWFFLTALALIALGHLYEAQRRRRPRNQDAAQGNEAAPEPADEEEPQPEASSPALGM